MFFVFNELSVDCIFLSNNINAKEQIDEFVFFMNRLVENKLVNEILLPQEFYLFYYSANYGIKEWFLDKTVNNNYKQFFRRFLDRYCRYFDVNEIEGEFKLTVNDTRHNALSCAFAFERENSLLSMSTDKMWKNTLISGEYTYLDYEGNLYTDIVSVENICTTTPFDSVVLKQHNQISNRISSGQDLWEKREELFPNLIFCENVKDQLYQDSERYHIERVMSKLSKLQNYFSQYDGIYDPKKLGMSARTESDTVKSNPALKDLRLFRKPNGEEEYFFDHIGFSGKYSGGRIYFLPDNDNKKCYIGYIGKHLKTKNF